MITARGFAQTAWRKPVCETSWFASFSTARVSPLSSSSSSSQIGSANSPAFTSPHRGPFQSGCHQHQPTISHGKIGAEQRLHLRSKFSGQFAIRPDFRWEQGEIQLRRVQRNVKFRSLMQAARHASGNFHGHFVMTVFTANTQPHIMTTQPRIRRFVVNIQQLAGCMMLSPAYSDVHVAHRQRHY